MIPSHDSPHALLKSTKAPRLPSEMQIPQVMPRILGTWDCTAIFVVSIFLISGATTVAPAGPAAITYLLLTGAIFFVPCLIATAQLGSMYPHEGALYNWTHKAIGGYWSFFSGFCAWFPCVLIVSSIANLIVSYGQELFQFHTEAPWQQGLAIIFVLLIGGYIASWRLRIVQNMINIAVGLLIVSALLVGLCGIIWFIQGQSLATNLGNWSGWQIQPDNMAMFGLLVFSYIGTENPLSMAGEMKHRQVIKRHLWAGALIIFLMYLINTVTILLITGSSAGNDPLTLVRIVDKVLGRPFAILIAISFICSCLGTVIVYNYLYARLLLVAGIDRRLPKSVCRLNKNQVPTNAIFFQTLLAVAFTVLTFIIAPLIAFNRPPQDFATEIYNVTLASASLVWTISVIFLFIDVIGCYIKDREHFIRHCVLPLPLIWIAVFLGFSSCILTIVDTLFFSWTIIIPNYRWWYLVGSLTLIFLIISTFSSMLARSEVAWQDMKATLVDTQKNRILRK